MLLNASLRWRRAGASVRSRISVYSRRVAAWRSCHVQLPGVASILPPTAAAFAALSNLDIIANNFSYYTTITNKVQKKSRGVPEACSAQNL